MQSIFKRYEKKYIITKEQSAFLQERLVRHMKIDRFGEYLVQNLYFDTENWDIVRESIEKPLYKEKLRLRFYGDYNPESKGFLELKKKFDGIVYKRRIAFSLGEIKKRCVREIVSEAGSQISREIDFFLNYRDVSEKIFIAYKRTAYNGIEDQTLRVSFDRDIVFRRCTLNCLNNDYTFCDWPCSDDERQILNENFLIMEIKTASSIPLWLTHMLSENNIFPVSFSKYGTCYTKHILKRQNLKEAGDAA
ncbi:MAG: polyphosphate polymerase domain-containing protein [Treponema sp.]|jgi:SPX domain protein involved in polyphosphate accumulation|nr:polyphosphate polymerase domain-containing protein [Treponema sp.]